MDLDCFTDEEQRKKETQQKLAIKSYRLIEYGRKLQLEKPVFSEEEVASILRSILSGLAKVHDLDLVHRDIKPENIVLGGQGIPDALAGDMANSEALR